jgi:microcystin-dependent protein
MAQDPFLGAIFLFGGNFAPSGYALCQGQLLPIAQNSALFAILGTTFGGDGVQNFALPDLRGRAPIETGQGTGLSDVILGESTGAQNVTILTSNLPAHTHLLNASSATGTQPLPTGNYLASVVDSAPGQSTAYNATANVTMSPTAVGITGGGAPINVQSPCLGLNFIIALQGVFPSRN